jgi:hypothetical protein
MVQEKLRGVFDFEKDDLWFRGMNLKALMLSMSFFVPVISTSNSDEFGPGIYASNDFDEGAKYAHPQGALMIFKNPDFRDLSVCKDEWNNLTATWLNIYKKMLKYLILTLMPTLSKGRFHRTNTKPGSVAVIQRRAKSPRLFALATIAAGPSPTRWSQSSISTRNCTK